MPPIKLCPKCKKNACRGGAGSYCVECATEMMERKVKESGKIIKAMKKPYEDLGLKVKFDGENGLKDLDNKKFKSDKQSKL